MKSIVYFLPMFTIVTMTGCGFVPEKVSPSDPRVIPLIQAAASFDRETYGFTPIPTNGDIRLESRATASYDVMLHFYGDTDRTIAFRKTPSGYRWIEEQEAFTGPNLYTNVDGVFYEKIFLTYCIESAAGFPTNKLNVQYWGDD